MAYTQYCMGKIQFDDNKFNESAINFKGAISLSENKECLLFPDIYEYISNLFYKN